MKCFCVVSCIVVLLAAALNVEAQAPGSASSRAVAISNGGNATSTASAKTDGNGAANATVVSVADKNSTARGEVSAESKDGADAVASLVVNATDGATVNATAEAKGEGKGAVAIVDSIAKASGNLALESEAVSEAINEGNGALVNLVLERAYADGEVLGDKVSKVVKVTIVKKISRNTTDVDVISASFSTALTSTPVYAARFAKILSSIVKENGCTYLHPYLTTAQAKAVEAGTEEALITAVHGERVLVHCAYPACGETEICCHRKTVEVHLCQKCPEGESCVYATSGKGVIPLMKHLTKNTEKQFCACPY